MSDLDPLRTFMTLYDLPEEAHDALSRLVEGEAPEMGSEAELPPGLEGVGLLGEGGMGEVLRVFEPRLRRHLALKTLHPHLAHQADVRARFLDEAQTTAQLQHPGVMPVHGFGTLPDGRPYFTMPEVKGRSLDALLAEQGTSTRRRIEIVRRACEAVGYAHEQGVVHRDLKPENIMVGAHGEVLVLDWGLARLVGTAEAPVGGVQTTRSAEGGRLTHAGAVLGTPAFMAPEQVLGEPVSPATDVYALGGVLFMALTGRPPREGSVGSILVDVVAGRPLPIEGVLPELAPLVRRCLARDPEDRPEHAGLLCEALQGWLDGAARRTEADALHRQAVEALDEARARAAAAADEAARARTQLQQLGPGAAEVAKRPWWDVEDAARASLQQADVLRLQAEQTLWAALTRAPDHLPSRRRLAEGFLQALGEAEARRDHGAALQAEVALQAQLPHLPTDEADALRKRLAADGRVSLVTEPAGATVTARPWVREGRRLVLGAPVALGITPLREARLPRGSWQLTLEAEGHHPVDYPVVLGRDTHWDGVPPGADAPAPVPLPPLGELGPEDRYVPRGWFVAGGDPEAPGSLPRQDLWCEGFIVRAFPIRCREHLAYVQSLVDDGRVDEALARSPREWHGLDQGGAAFWFVDDDGRVAMGPDTDGDVWDPEWPLLMADYATFVAHAAWRAATDGVPWRLPSELEWEKAARGVDARQFPWGDHHDPTWCAMRDSPDLGPAVGDAYPVDTSPYGVRHLAGSAADWCLEAADELSIRGQRVEVPTHDPTASRHTSRGGSWGSTTSNNRAAFRGFGATGRGLYSLSARLVRSWPRPSSEGSASST